MNFEAWSSLCNSFDVDDWTLVDFNYTCLIFKWVEMTWLKDGPAAPVTVSYSINRTALCRTQNYILLKCYWLQVCIMSSGREERSGSTSDSREKKDTPAAPRGKRYERDRRGNWGRNERRKEWVGKGEPPEASAVSHREDRSETETKRPERGTSNSKDRRKSTDDRDTDDYDTGRDRKYTPRPRRDSRETREGPKREERGPRPKDGGRDRDRDRDYDRDRDSHRDRDPRDRDDRRSSGSYRGGGGGSGSRSKGQGDGPGGKMSGRQADRGR